MSRIDRRYQAAVMEQKRHRDSDLRARERREKFRVIEGGGEPATPVIVPEGAENTLDEVMASRRAAIAKLTRQLERSGFA